MMTKFDMVLSPEKWEKIVKLRKNKTGASMDDFEVMRWYSNAISGAFDQKNKVTCLFNVVAFYV